jgi:serine/threonine protein phosphatase 1
MPVSESSGPANPEAAPKPGWIARLLGLKTSVPAVIPPGRRVYAIGDIHGRLDLLHKLLELIEADDAGSGLDRTVIFMGDYVDRGPESKGVIDLLLGQKTSAVLCLRGNHDQAVLDFLADAKFYRQWREFGAPETLLSYGVMPPRFEDDADFERARVEFEQKLPPEHLRFFSALPYSHAVGDYLFVHAGLRPGVALERQDPHDLLWIRDEFLLSRLSFGKIVVHGHSPTPGPVRRPNRIGIDTGAYATGRLTAVVLEGTDCRFLST